jgi:hypothetical protein
LWFDLTENGRIRMVAREQLIATVTRERHLHMPARQSRHRQRRHGGTICERLAEVLHQIGQCRHRVRFDSFNMVFATATQSSLFGPLPFVVLRGFMSNREASHWLRQDTAHVPHDSARIDPPRKKGTERDICYQVR